MPVFETLGLSATTALGIGAAGAAIGGIGSLGLGIYNASKKAPGYNPQQALGLEQQQFAQMAPQALGFGSNAFNQATQEGMQFAPQATAQQIALQNKVTPGSSAQREEALRQINSYIQGQVPLDVQQNINREVAQNLGGGFNLFSGGGQAPQNFARNLGQTSLGLSQYGLSAAPTWQQLANTMVVSPVTATQLGLGAIGAGTQLAGYAAGQGATQAENQYQAAMNQYGAQQAGTQGIAQGLGALGSAGGALMNAGIMGQYYGGMGTGASYNPAQGAQTTLMGTGYTNPAASTPFAQSAGALPSIYSSGASFGSGLNPALNYTSGLTFGWYGIRIL